MSFRPINTAQLQVAAKPIAVCSCGGNQLIDKNVGGNEGKIRQAVDSCVGIRIILVKKNSKAMSNAFMLHLRGKILEISWACVCFFYTTFCWCFIVHVYKRAPE